MELETNYSELLRAKSEASVKAILDYAKEQIENIEWENIREPQEVEYYDQMHQYWRIVEGDSKQELEFRIKQIFPL